MELTPEKFEKAEFAERRRGYDIDQVESFLEETGTEFARMLAKFRHTEKRAAEAETRVSEFQSEVELLRQKLAVADERVTRAEQSAKAAVLESDNADEAESSISDEDVASVARTLVLAQQAANKAVKQAKAESRAILNAARARAEKQLSEATTDAETMLAEAETRAEREFAGRRKDALAEVGQLQTRRTHLSDVISRMDERIVGYRQDLRRAAAELVAIAEDPALMGEVDPLAAEDDDKTVPDEVEPPEDEDVSAENTIALGDEVSDAKVAPTASAHSAEPSRSTEQTAEPEAVDLVDSSDGEPGPDAPGDGEPGPDAPGDGEPGPDEPEGPEGSSDGHSATAEAAHITAAEDDTATGDDSEAKSRLSGDSDDSDEYLDIRTSASSDDSGSSSDDGQTETPAPAAAAASEDVDAGEWGPGSWAQIASSLPPETDEEESTPASTTSASQRGSSPRIGLEESSRSEQPSGSTVTAEASTSVHPVAETSQTSSEELTDNRPREDELTDDRPREDELTDDRPTEAVEKLELIRDRYLEELDQAVNTNVDPEDEALAAFLEGNSDPTSRRFGWKR